MTKIFISQPMKGKTNEEILAERAEAVAKLEKHMDDIHVIDTVLTVTVPEHHPGLVYLAHSIEMLDDADVLVCIKGWQKARGCRIEHECAKAYGIPIYYL